MARIGRIVIPGAAHHVTQRGNNRQDVFFVDEDRRTYLELLQKYGELFGLRVMGYCLMTNHIHVVAVPAQEDSLAKAMGRTHFAYTQHVNRRHGRSGHLWQNRFYSCVLDEAQAINALAYAELNPVRAGLAKKPWTYPWSSAAAHCGRGPARPPLDMADWRERTGGTDWIATLEAVAGDPEVESRIRLYTRTGRPLGGDRFLSKLEALLERRIRPLPEGRPKGWRKPKPTAKRRQQ